MGNKQFFYVSFFALILIFGCKSKTELYLERGLDILSNVKKIDFNLYQGVTINEVGVIRDQKEETKTLVFKLDSDSDLRAFENDNIIGIRVWIVDNNNNKRKEDWDLKPKLIQSGDYKYIIKEINVKEDRIKKMKIYAYQLKNGEKRKIGSSILLQKIYTYND